MTTLSKLYTSGVDINWENFHRYSNSKKVNTPTYPFQLKPYWIDLTSDRISPIHPLVGSPVPNPSELKIFRNVIDIKKLPYLADHMVGTKVIFPGAGFLEMCLVSGYSAVQCTETMYTPTTSPLTIEDFKIEKPLCLSENEKTQLQVVASTSDNGETAITIYSKLNLDKETQKWIKHASGKFSPFASKWHGEEDFLKSNLDNILKRCKEDWTSQFCYKKFTELGVVFGPTFQTVKEFWKGDAEVCVKLEITTDLKSYILHPTMIDGMFQTLMVCINPEAKKMHVPISVTKFIYMDKLTTDSCYVYIKLPTASTDYIAVLLDISGNVIAVMEGAEFIETTVSNITALVESQRLPYPPMYDNVWREQLGAFERRVCSNDLYEGAIKQSKIIEDSGSAEIYNTLSKEEEYFYEKSNRLNGLYMIQALQDLGLELSIGKIINFEETRVILKVQDHFKRWLHYMFVELSNDGYFKMLPYNNEISNFEVQKIFPDKQTVVHQIDSLYHILKEINSIEVSSVASTAKRLAEILVGETLALPILFPENGKAGPAELYYKNSEMNRKTNEASSQIFTSFFKLDQNDAITDKRIMRVLEVGSGTGSFTENFLSHLLKDGPSHYEYTYTDISPAFFRYGEEIFKDSKVRVQYKVLDIEKDPMKQGFIPQQYDIIFACNVIHATDDVQKSMNNIRALLSPGGLVAILELTKPLRSVNLLFGAVEGFWKFKDTNLRPHNCEMKEENWRKVFYDLGFEHYAHTNVYNLHSSYMCGVKLPTQTNQTGLLVSQTSESRKHWWIFSKNDVTSKFITKQLLEMGKQVSIITAQEERPNESKNVDAFTMHSEESSPFLSTFMYSISEDNLQFFQLLSENVSLEGIIYLWGLNYSDTDYKNVCRPFLNLCKFLVNREDLNLIVFTRGSLSVGDCNVSLPSASPIISMSGALQNENPCLTVKCVDLDKECNEKSLQEAFAELFVSDGEHCVVYRKNQRIVPRCIPLKLTSSALKFPNTRSFKMLLPESLVISDIRFGVMDLPPLKDNHVEVQIKAFALNFRDVFSVMKPDPMFDNSNTVGIDYSGTVTALGSKTSNFKIGDSVFGVNLSGIAMPSHLQVDEELLNSIPDSMTYCEAATLPAVAVTAYVCLVETAKIKAEDTILIHVASGGVGLCAIQIAKSYRCNIVATAGSKRKRKYLRNLGIKHVFHSRNTSFEAGIRDALGGNKVDIVLNSLTGEGFKEASLAVCNTNARFVEMSKLNVWTAEDVKALRPDVHYTIIDVSTMSEASIKDTMNKIKPLLKDATVKPIPYVRFDASDVRDALNYLQKAKHIGKIVCVMPENVFRSSDVETPLFNDRSTYLITGGLGGIGLEVAKWMGIQGAKHIVLVGRNPPNEKTKQGINKLIHKKINIQTVQCDVGDREQCIKLLEEIKVELELPQLRGIMHAAGVLSDDLYENQTWENFEAVFNPKVRGGWNLHELTIDYQLEHFVMFSSITGILGSMGQSNHSASNYFLDSLAHYRHSIGLPATTINWGQWGQVGVAANIEVKVLQPFTVLQGVSSLDKIMRSQRLQTTVVSANIGVLRKHFVSSKKMLEEIQSVSLAITDHATSAEAFWKSFDESITREEKYQVVEKFVCDMVRTQIKLEESDVLTGQSNFQDLGMDSLMMIEMKNGLQMYVGKRVKLTISSLKDCKTVSQLSNRLVDLILGSEIIPRPTQTELIQLIKEDSELPEEIQTEEECTLKPSQISTILIIGVTGNFGPYVLREICKRPEITKIYCLIRDIRKESPKESLKQMLTNKKLICDIDMNKIVCYSSDIIKPLFGLEKKTYQELATTVDAIFHLAVKADFGEFYCRAKDPQHSRLVNVFGTLNVLKFSSFMKTKLLFHASTGVSTSLSQEDGSFSESWPIAGELDEQLNNNSSYVLSKHVCDRLMAQAVERGIPCKVFRFPFMGGDSKLGGNISILGNILMIRMLIYMRVGKMPAISGPIQIIPIDTCAEMSLGIFFNDETPYEVYNVSNPYAEDELLLEDIAQEFGYQVEAVEREEFFKSVENLEGPSSDEIKEMVKRARQPQFDENEDLEESPPQYIVAWLSGQKNVFLSKKLMKWLPEIYPSSIQPAWEILKTDLRFARKNGDFAKFGLK